MPRRPKQTFGGQTGSGIWWRKRFAELETVDDGNDIAASLSVDDVSSEDNSVSEEKELTVNDPFSATVGRCQVLDSEEEEIGNDVEISSSPTAMPTSDFHQHNSQLQQSIGWDDDLCRPIYYQHSDLVVSSEGDDDSDGTVVENEDGQTQQEEEIHKTNEDIKNKDLPLPFVSVPKKSHKKQRTYGDRQAVRPPFSLVLSRQDCFSPEQKEANEEETVESQDGKGRRTSKRRFATTKTMPHTMDSLVGLPSPQNSNHVSTPQKNRRVSTSPDMDSDKDAHGTGQDIFAFDTTKSTNQAKKRARLERSLIRERDFFKELDKTQKLNVEDAASTPTSPVAVEPVLRAPKFVFRPNLRKSKNVIHKA
ncbi:hypothetical protein IV203_035640 [Nitzschia inconspicua]|uniref:Uncharacterized protein n=1 Tax=Nitzschia inconspicua TaxID=303405 RepID=A0A9K3LGN0_9STRA|nr:hypothetical protein IV203_035640 [Nitzschia inconspicua]